MPTKSAMRKRSREGDRGQQPVVARCASITAPKLATTSGLMGSGYGLTVPRLDGVPLEHSLTAADEPCIALAKTLLNLDIAVPEDWEKAKHDPTTFIGLTLARWIAAHGVEAIKRRFDLTTAITSCLDEYSDRDSADANSLYLVVDSDRSGYVVFGPTFGLLEKVHPRLAVTFYNLLAGALNKWVRVYDYRDAEERVAMLREWAEGEPDEDQYEIADVKGCMPACMKRRPLGSSGLRQVISQIKVREAKALLEEVIALARISERADRPELTDEMREEMGDMNPPLPGLLAVFTADDAIEAHFDEEAQTWLELAPEPSLIVPLNADQPRSVHAAFHRLGIVCDTLAATSRLIDQMPGNDKWVIQGGSDGSAGTDRR